MAKSLPIVLVSIFPHIKRGGMKGLIINNLCGVPEITVWTSVLLMWNTPHFYGM